MLNFGLDLGLGIKGQGRFQNVESEAEYSVTRPRPRYTGLDFGLRIEANILASMPRRAKNLLLARLMGQYCFAAWRPSSSVVVRNAAMGGPAAGSVGGLAADTARRASRVTSRYGDTLFILHP